jgi:hypothetical protein
VTGAPLVCPRCSSAHAGDERFCRECGMPLVFADRTPPAGPVDEARERARKVKRQYAEGALVQVAGARHLPEAELIQGLLLEEGVPSLLRRTRGFDVPEMLAAGPRDVLVPQSGYATAREVLLKEGMLSADAARRAAQDRPSRVLAVLLGAVLLVGLLVWLGNELLAV